MQALHFDGRQLRQTDVPAPEPRPGEALIRVLMAGICNTDLELVKGYMGFRGVLGHEFVGVVEACDDAAWIGRRVVGEINCGCGSCPLCAGGDARHCGARTVLGILGRDGAMAERVRLPVRNLHEVPAAVPTEEALFAEPLAAAYAIPERVAVRPTDRVVVLGDGKLGLLVAQVLARLDCDLTVVGRHDEKLALLRDCGIATTRDLPHGADVVVDCTGSPRGIEQAIAAVRPRGTIVLKTTVADAAALQMAPLVINEVRLVGSRCGPFGPALRALEQGAVRVRPLVSRVVPLRDGLAAFEEAARAGVVKVQLQVGT